MAKAAELAQIIVNDNELMDIDMRDPGDAEELGKVVCVCFLLQDLVQSCLRGGGGYGRTCATRDDEPRPVWTSLPITH
jgi:hypothetical protein